MRISDGLMLLATSAVVAGCSSPTTPSDPEALAAQDDSRVACALGGETEFTDQCDAERVENGATRELVMRHPDGGFRRFEIVTDGRGLVAADGSEDAVVVLLADGRIELSVGSDRYRLPATVKPGAGGG